MLIRGSMGRVRVQRSPDSRDSRRARRQMDTWQTGRPAGGRIHVTRGSRKGVWPPPPKLRNEALAGSWSPARSILVYFLTLSVSWLSSLSELLGTFLLYWYWIGGRRRARKDCHSLCSPTNQAEGTYIYMRSWPDGSYWTDAMAQGNMSYDQIEWQICSVTYSTSLLYIAAVLIGIPESKMTF